LANDPIQFTKETNPNMMSPFSNRSESYTKKKNDKRKIDDVNMDDDSDVESTDSNDCNNSKELSRERNREHARRTRMRKKLHLMNLRRLVTDLEKEASTLAEARDNIFLASILVDMGNLDSCQDGYREFHHGAGYSTSPSSLFTQLQQNDMYKNFQSNFPPIQKCNVIDKAQNQCLIDMQASVEKLALSGADLETLKRERNRIHAKMTRNRKRELISGLEQRVYELEESNRARRDMICRTLHENLPTNTIPRVAVRLGILN